jgi:PAS domain S-box-containing protein
VEQDTNDTRGASTGWLLAGIGSVAVIFALTAGIGVLGASRLYESEQRVRHSNEVMLILEHVLSLVKDAETGQRGYLITGDEHYLEPYRDARTAIDDAQQRLALLTLDEPAQQASLAELQGHIAAKLAELANAIQIRREQGFAAAQQLVLTDLGKKEMDAARSLVADLAREEQRRLKVREFISTNAHEAGIAASLFAGVLGFTLCIALVWLLRRHFLAQTRATAQIHAQRELFRTTLASIGDGVITTGVTGRITFLNQIAQSLTGWSQEEAADQSLENVFRIVNESTRQDVENPAIRALRDGVIVGLANHTLLIRRDGSEIPIDDSGAPIRNAEGVALGAVLVFRDIGERKRAEELLKDADRRKDEFLATLAHELRNPLAPLRNALHLARNTANAGTPPEELLGMMERQVQQMTRLVDDLLDVARITRGKLELRTQPINIAATIYNALETCAPFLEEGRHGVTVAMPEQGLLVDGDQARLAQVLCNLLSNAAKYSEAGSPIVVTASRQQAEVVIVVRDQGIGIPAEMLMRIFDMFSQADRSLERAQGGLGIGLTIAQRIVEMHGGRIEVKSAGTGQGSEFTVCLPASNASAVAAAPERIAVAATHSPAPQAQLAGMPVTLTVLVADDNLDSVESLGMLLGATGYQVHLAHDGREAVESATRLQPHVVLLDIGMPKLNGYDAARRIREQPWAAGALMIAVTGWGQDADRQRSLDAGFDHHLIKPVDADVLERLLQAFKTRLVATGAGRGSA